MKSNEESFMISIYATEILAELRIRGLNNPKDEEEEKNPHMSELESLFDIIRTNLENDYEDCVNKLC